MQVYDWVIGIALWAERMVPFQVSSIQALHLLLQEAGANMGLNIQEIYWGKCLQRKMGKEVYVCVKAFQVWAILWREKGRKVGSETSLAVVQSWESFYKAREILKLKMPVRGVLHLQGMCLLYFPWCPQSFAGDSLEEVWFCQVVVDPEGQQLGLLSRILLAVGDWRGDFTWLPHSIPFPAQINLSTQGLEAALLSFYGSLFLRRNSEGGWWDKLWPPSCRCLRVIIETHSLPVPDIHTKLPLILNSRLGSSWWLSW